MASKLEEKSSAKSFGGYTKVFTHQSSETKTPMTFGVILPPQAESQKCPVLYYLSGLCCTEQNFITKAGAQRVACELGIIVVCPDTSPRECNIDGEDDDWDFGSAASFYVDATEEKWKNNYQMYSYVTKELTKVIADNFPTNGLQSIFGHSMGGHGSLVLALKNPGLYKSASAFAPICNPIKVPWGQKAFSGYLGSDKESWKAYDATELTAVYSGPNLELMVDQGTNDQFIQNLETNTFVEAVAANKNLKLVARYQDGYDHGYYFISTFVEDHLRFHAKHLSA